MAKRIISLLLALALFLSILPTARAVEDVTQPAEETMVQTEPTVAETTEAIEETIVPTTAETTPPIIDDVTPPTTGSEPEDIPMISAAYPLPSLTGDQRIDIVNIAASQLGYTYSGGTIYGQWWTSFTNWGVDYTWSAWCGMFVCWCADKANAGLNIAFNKNGASAGLLFDWYRQNAVYDESCTTTPQIGDLIFFEEGGGISHVAIITDYDSSANKVTFIGGNQGNAVTRETVTWAKGSAWGSSYVYGYGRPNYSSSSSDEIAISGTSVPTAITTGSTYPVRGTVTSGQPITQVTVGIYDAAGEMKTGSTAYPNARSYNLANVDAYVLFDILTPGVYSYRVTVTNTSKTEVFELTKFTVLANTSLVADGTYVFRTADSSLVLEAVSDTDLQIAAYDNGPTQAFQLVHQSDGYYSVYNAAWDRYLDVDNAGTTGGTGVGVTVWNGGTAQLWQLLPVGSSWCLVPKCTPGLCLDIIDGAIAEGTELQLSAPKLTDAQLFSLESYTSTVLNGQCGENAFWNFNISTGTLTISGTGAITVSSTDIPWKDFLDQIKHLIIGDGIAEICAYAFMNCTEITEVVLPDSITSLGFGAFYGCTKLSEITMSANIEHVGDNPFTNTAWYYADQVGPRYAGKALCYYFDEPGVTSYTVQRGTRAIAKEAFQRGCDLTEIVIPGGIKSIGMAAFRGCENLTTVTFTGSAPEWIAPEAFMDVTVTARYPAGNSTWTEDIMQDYQGGGDGKVTWVAYEVNPERTTPMYRLYNPYTNEHLFLTNPDERAGLIAAGWTDEGIGWQAITSGPSVYRLYNPYGDFHFYTNNPYEVESLITLGWTLDGPVSYDAGPGGTPIYRLFNPYELTNYHHYTTSMEEATWLVSLGYILEGIAWYGA